MSITTPDELRGLRRSASVVSNTLQVMFDAVRTGITTAELDRIGEAQLARHGAEPAPRATYGFPGATCISVNDEVAHGVPGNRVLESGDLVNIDVSARLDGFVTDTGASRPVGPADPEILRLCRAGRAALEAGVGAIRTGARFARLGWAVEREVTRQGFKVIRDLTGHGVGRALHEEPSDVRSFYEPRDPRRMTEGLVFTVEPMVSRTAERVREGGDGWTLRTVDGSRVVQFEHTVVVTRDGPLVLTVLPSLAA